MNYIVFDLEWNQGIAGKRESSHEEIPFEIIEIGAIKLDKRKNIIGQFQKIIKPSVYKKMPDIIEDMLHVDMKELRAGTPFPEAAEEFLAWCGEDFMFCSWGSLDLLVRRIITGSKREKWVDTALLQDRTSTMWQSTPTEPLKELPICW